MRRDIRGLSRRGVSALLLGATALLGGCGLFSSSYRPPKPAPLPVFKPAARVGAAWSAEVGGAGTDAFSPALAGDAVYAAGENGRLYRFDVGSGRKIWAVDTGIRLSAGVGAGDHCVVVATNRGRVLAYSDAGKPLWQAQVSSSVLSPPAVSGGLVMVRSADGRITALNAADGKEKWFYQQPLPSLTLRSFAGVLALRGAVFAGFPGGQLVALALENGNTGWSGTVAEPKGGTALERIADVTSLPVTDGQEICAVAYRGRLACFDIRSGNLLWAKPMSSTAGLAMGTHNVYVSEQDGTVAALDKSTGVSLWSQSALHRRTLTAPVLVGPYVAVGDYQGYVHFLSRADGAFVARAATDGSRIAAPLVPWGDEGCLAQTKDGTLTAFRVQ
ncbi:MAG: outer membrane protein assembly factor BamB [Betaproteobacteria bacterium]|nr:outer membrane protein assembly factor BamB [Betaproteobacteria bacterium]